jgi:dihydrolipoamide dehydrogenase
MKELADVLVIGAGPGGYPAAIRAAQLGKKVIIVEKGYIGGECLNWGCIPSKALISAAKVYHRISDSVTMGKLGISVEKPKIDIQQLQKWKISVQTQLIDGIRQLLKENKVKTIIGTAKLTKANEVTVTLDNGDKISIEVKDIIIATGSEFISLPNVEIDEETILSAKGALSLDSIPESLVVIGGGAIGLEIGTIFVKLGSKVKIIELLPEILPWIDPSLARIVKINLKKMEVELYTSSKVKAIKQLKNNQMKITVETKTGTIKLLSEKILVSVGKEASVNNLNLENIGIAKNEKGFIIVNSHQQTNIPNVYAIGDCTGEPFLAHKATKQGIVAAEVIAGLPSEFDFKAMPSVFFTDPEIAMVGLTEKEAKEKGYQVNTGRTAFGASGRALTQQSELGFVKVVADAKSNVLYGVQMVGPEVSELISEASLALEMGATIEDLGFTVHPHPTLSETLMEASDAALNKAIHQINKRK